MALIADLNAAWLEGKENRSVQAFRSAAKKIDLHAGAAKTRIDELIAEGTFGTVAQTIKDEGTAVRTLINEFVTAMESHAEFINWRPPTE